MESPAGIAPFRPARERCLPVDETFAAILPDQGLVRGRTIGCTGPAAVSIALGLASRAITAGSWLAVVGLPSLGVEAAIEAGVPASRMVFVDLPEPAPGAATASRTWAERVVAAADGFEVILTSPPAGADRVAGKLRQRIQARGVVVLAVGSTTPGVPCDVELATSSVTWEGLGQGCGRLTRRRVTVRAGGRRVPRPVERELWLPGGRGPFEPVGPPITRLDGVDPAELSRAG